MRALVLFLVLVPTLVHGSDLALDEPAGAVLSWSPEKASVRAGKGQLVLFSRGSYEEGCEGAFESTLVSAVGPYLTFLQTSNGFCEGAAHPWSSTGFATYDARTGKLARLTEAFDEPSVLAALNGDAVILKALDGKPATTLAELFERADGGCETAIGDWLLGAFAFHHLKGGQVAVRIGLGHGCEVMRGKFTQLGLYLPASKELPAWLKKAEARGLLMKSLSRK
jgi:hypothetical protein